MAQETTNASIAAGAELSFADVGATAAKVHSVRTAAVQPQKIAAPCINDRFSRGTAAVEGCVSRPKGRLCKGRFLRIADLGAQRSMWVSVC